MSLNTTMFYLSWRESGREREGGQQSLSRGRKEEWMEEKENWQKEVKRKGRERKKRNDKKVGEETVKMKEG